MRHKRQNNVNYGAIGSGKGNQRRRNCNFKWESGWSAGYEEKYGEPGEVYIMLGLLRGFRLRAKIGRSRNHKRRLAYLKDDFGKFIFPVFVISTNNMIRLEQAAHCRFQTYREHEDRGSGRTEWFRINPLRLIKMIWFIFYRERLFYYFDHLSRMKTGYNIFSQLERLIAVR